MTAFLTFLRQTNKKSLFKKTKYHIIKKNKATMQKNSDDP